MPASQSDKNTIEPDQFSLARVAAVLGRDVRELRRSMAGRESDGQCLVSGNVTRSYLVSSLPESVRLELEQFATLRGFGCPERLLGRAPDRWEHPTPVSEIHTEEITRAKKRAMALTSGVKALSDGSRPATELREFLALAHKQALGYGIAYGTMDNLVQRVIERDAGHGEYDRWELYLPESPKRICVDGKSATSGDFVQVDAYLAEVNVAAPSINDRAWVWTAMCDNLQTLIEHGDNHRVARRRIIKHVFARASWMSSSRQSLAKCFDTKWVRYSAGERMISDGRPARSGYHREMPLTDDDEKKLIARALTHGGGLAAAWTDCLRNGGLSSAVTANYISNPASKSYVPATIRDRLGPKIKALQDIHHGPRQAKLKGAYISRDWSDVAAGDWYQADDNTPGVYYWEEDAAGTPRVLRGQFLPMIDCRTGRVLTFALHSDRNYTAKVIRGLILATHDAYGLPRIGFHFENGIWRSSKLLKGTEAPADFVEVGETEVGLREWVRFMHAKPGNARAKVVERVIGLLQDRMEDQPGYVGRNEQTEKFERVQKSMRDVAAGKILPSSFLLHRDEWVSRLTKICDEYNEEKQDGRIKGQSPREAWDSFFDQSRPLVRLTPETRYLLVNHRRPLKVTKNGICVQLGKERHWFRNEETGRLINRIVQVYFDPEDLSSIFVKTKLSDNSAFVVPAAVSIPAMSATREQMASAMASVNAHNQPSITLYKTLTPHFAKNGQSIFRKTIADVATVEAGRDIQFQKEEIRQQLQNEDQDRRSLGRLSRRMGHLPDADAVSTARQLAAMKLIEEGSRNADT